MSISKNLGQKIVIVCLIILAIFLLIYSFVAPGIETEFLEKSTLLPNDDKDILAAKGQVGDKFGGIMNPFIAMAGVIITGLAFYMQYQANELLKNQIKKTSIETTFYQLLALHKENVNQLEIINPKNNLPITGRSVFSYLKKHFHEILAGCMIVTVTEVGATTRSERKTALNQNLYNNCYYFFMFNGRIANKKYPYIAGNDSISVDCNVFNNIKASEYLAHYFRHLYFIVKYINNQPKENLDDEEKQQYFKILRAQLSNDEQTLLFYNWLATDFGGNWENEHNQYFTKLNMIHNLWYTELWDCMYSTLFIQGKITELKQKHMHYNGMGSTMFEIDE